MTIQSVVLLHSEGRSRIHPAAARRMLKQGRALRVAGAGFRLATPDVKQRITLWHQEGHGRGGRLMLRLKLVFDRPVIHPNAVARDARCARGGMLDHLMQDQGRAVRDLASNHDTAAKPRLAWSLGESDRIVHVTILHEDDSTSFGLLDLLAEGMPGASFPVVRGWDVAHLTTCLKAVSETVESSGCYRRVVAPDASAAMALVPGAFHAEPDGVGGRRGEGMTWTVKTKRRKNLPLQVGPGASIGCGLLQ